MPGRIGANALRELIVGGGELAILDVREEGVFSERHMLYASSLPLSRLELSIYRLVPRRSSAIVLCDDGDGLSERAAVSLAKRFAGFEIPFESEDMGDAIGELTNMLAGQIKLNLDQKGVSAEISLPSVIRAQDITVLTQQQNSVDKRCFTSELGKFWTGAAVVNKVA